jgi:hypothetical protein
MTTANQTKVKVDLQFTRNLGNFESVRVAIGVEDFIRSGENTSQATDRVYKFVEEKLIEKTKEIEAELKGKK